jgi:hypothetical protein
LASLSGSLARKAGQGNTAINSSSQTTGGGSIKMSWIN